MQVFESILFLLSILSIVMIVKHKLIKSKFIIILNAVSILFLLLHLFLENARWQLIPLYIVLVLTTSITFIRTLRVNTLHDHRLSKSMVVIISLLFLFLSGSMKYVFPLNDIPTPTGDFKIGTESFVLTDENREEIYADTGDRRIKIQFWYPAETTDGYDLVPWLEDGAVVAQGLATDTGLPSFVLNHTALIMSNSYSKAPINNTLEEYPVVIISHGWRGFKNLHTDLAEELASIGYIVIAIDHTYGSVATVLNEEEVAYLNYDALPERDETSDFMDYANTLVTTYAGDITLTINELEKMNTGEVISRFEGKLDLSNIGLLGHSTGGGAGALVAINDDRIKALFGMDSWVEPIHDNDIETGLNIPTVFLRSNSWATGLNNANLNLLVDNNIGNTRLYQIQTTTHYDFSMAYMYSPLTKPLGMTGGLDGDYLVEIFKSMMTDFFDQTLKVDNNVGLIIIDDPWDEVLKIK